MTFLSIFLAIIIINANFIIAQSRTSTNRFIRTKKYFCLGVIFFLQSFVLGQVKQDVVNGNLIQFNDNGLWCWFQDERAIVDKVGGKIIFGAEESQSGTGGAPRNGVVRAVIYELNSGSTQRFTLRTSGCDDHNIPGFAIRPDGKYIAMYSDHYDNYNRYRIFDGNSWSQEQVYDWANKPGGTDFTIAYNNLYYLSSEGKMYDFTRANHRAPNFLISSDMGSTWNWGGQLTTNTSSSYNKGYYKYWSNGINRIDFIFTEQHPRDTLTSIYHGYIENNKAYKSDGSLVDDDIRDTTFIPAYWNFTKVFSNGTTIGEKTFYRCWQSDLVRYDDGTIAAIITARSNQYISNGYPDDQINPPHDFIYCRFNGINWSYTYLDKAGYKFYSSEGDYVGLAALCPNDPNTLYISTPYDPRDTTIDLGVREIFKGVTTNNGVSWNWTPITQNSTRDNVRPIVPAWDDNNMVVLWCRGTYISAQSFDAAIVGIIENKLNPFPELMTYIDADLSNTTLANGNVFVPTGPDANIGADDNQWHQRTGYGNGGSVFTSSESGDGEDAPLLKTQITIPKTGIYDIWVNFWANPSYDWRIKAGLSENNMQVYRSMACKQVDSNAHKTLITLTGNNNTFLYQAYIGRIEAEESGVYNMYIDDYSIQTGSQSTTIGNTARTWYDGISYADVNVIVPVELTDFTAVKSGDNIELKWSTASELNNVGFEIEKQIILNDNQSDWHKIAFIEGKGSTTGLSDYNYADITFDASASLICYRLKQIDFDGTYHYSKVVEVTDLHPYQYALLQNYPNPFNPVTNIKFSVLQNEMVTLKVYNVVGEEVAVLINKIMSPGSYTASWKADNVPSGVYFYQISAGNFNVIKKMILLK